MSLTSWRALVFASSSNPLQCEALQMQILKEPQGSGSLSAPRESRQGLTLSPYCQSSAESPLSPRPPSHLPWGWHIRFPWPRKRSATVLRFLCRIKTGTLAIQFYVAISVQPWPDHLSEFTSREWSRVAPLLPRTRVTTGRTFFSHFSQNCFRNIDAETTQEVSGVTWEHCRPTWSR